MSKVLRDEELAAIVSNIVNHDDAICEQKTYLEFVEDLAKLITQYCGGSVVYVSAEMGDDLGYCAHIAWKESVPESGGVYAAFDTDVPVDEWRDDALNHPQMTLPEMSRVALS